MHAQNWSETFWLTYAWTRPKPDPKSPARHKTLIRRPPQWFGVPIVIRRPGNYAPLATPCRYVPGWRHIWWNFIWTNAILFLFVWFWVTSTEAYNSLLSGVSRWTICPMCAIYRDSFSDRGSNTQHLQLRGGHSTSELPSPCHFNITILICCWKRQKTSPQATMSSSLR